MANQQQSEEAAELLATMRSEHIPMKTWYNNPQHSTHLSSLHSKYGTQFPTFWRDLINWDGWRDVRREYLKFTENGNRFVESNNNKRSRWADDNNNNATTTSTSDGQPQPKRERKRKSRWGRDPTPKPSIDAAPTTATTSTISNDPVMAALGLTNTSQTTHPTHTTTNNNNTAELAQLQNRLRQANTRLSNLETEAARIDSLPHNHPDRSPSPPPIYGPDGTRTNTRVARWRTKYTEERATCLERIMQLRGIVAPNFISKRKRSKKIPIPVEQYPTYNFIGLIIGPRGKTQKEMESKTGCKIAIRGKGSVKEGARGRRNGVPLEGEDEPLHVVITGDDPAAIDAAAEMIESMLVVIDDEKNVHKQNQLRELALLNGTLKEEEWCSLCGEKGHKNYECPKRFSAASGGGSGGGLQIKCAICGDTSHPTRDCKMGKNAKIGEEDLVKKERQLDSDYSAFMAELDGKSSDATAAGGTCIPVAKSGDNGGDGVVGATATASSGVGESVLTILQPARVVQPGEVSATESSSVAVPAATAPVDGNSFVTTISAAAPVVTTISAAAPVPASTASTVPTPSATGVTTISTSTTSAVTTKSSTAPAPATDDTATTQTLPPMPTSLPPPPPGAPPPSVSNIMSFPPPPPPTGLPPPPPSNSYGTGYSQPPPPPQYPPQQYPGSHPYQYQQPPPGSYPQHTHTAQQQQQQWGGWNQNYYGNDQSGGGAGGFNWWENAGED